MTEVVQENTFITVIQLDLTCRVLVSIVRKARVRDQITRQWCHDKYRLSRYRPRRWGVSQGTRIEKTLPDDAVRVRDDEYMGHLWSGGGTVAMMKRAVYSLMNSVVRTRSLRPTCKHIIQTIHKPACASVDYSSPQWNRFLVRIF